MSRMECSQEDRVHAYQECLAKNPRMYRIVGSMQTPLDDVAAVASSHVLGPTLGGFVLWILQDAMKSGKRRLYFLARDGYLMYRAALIFCEKFRLPIECRYVSVSRYSIRIPIFHLDPEAALGYVCRGGMGVTLEKVLGRAGLTQEEREKVLASLDLTLAPNTVIPFAKLPEIRRKLGQCELFREYMTKHSKDAMPGLAGYLRQEGLLENISDAIVDSGWTGSMQKLLGDVLSQLGRTRALEGYYWGLYELPPRENPAAYHCHSFDPGGHLQEKVYFNNCLFEAVYSAPHGMTLGYRKEREGYVPLYGKTGEGRNEFMKEIEGVVVEYIHRLAEDIGERGFERETFSEDKETIQQLLKHFMGEPSRAEAEVFGSLPFSDDVLDSGEQPLAALLTERELTANHVHHKLLVMSGLRDGCIRESAWYEGSVVRCGRHVRRHLRQHALYQYLRYIRKMYAFRKERRGHR